MPSHEELPPVPGAAGDPAPADDRALAPGLAGEAEAWARVLEGWADEAVHRAYLARFVDLEGLAVAGGRYRAVLAERPTDLVARRWRDEVVKRATVAGLASLPRSSPEAADRVRVSVRRVATAAVVLVLVALLAAWGGDLAEGVRALWP